jgi:hypothetical protein
MLPRHRRNEASCPGELPRRWPNCRAPLRDTAEIVFERTSISVKAANLISLTGIEKAAEKLMNSTVYVFGGQGWN